MQIHSGEWQVEISDATNHVWDVSLIAPLQSPDFEFSDGTIVAFNDAIKKVGGTATVDLSGGRTLGFTAKGTYNAKTDSTLLVLAADADSNGSSLKVTWSANNSAVLQGKLTGQTVKAVGTIEPD